MTHVITEPCILCKYTDCVEVCPVDAFRDGKNMLVIDPEECIDCRLCVPECPVNAIYPGDEVPNDQQAYFEVNQRFAQRWPVITRRRPLAGGDEWATSKAKGDLLDPEGAN
jgi:ferredoxin